MGEDLIGLVKTMAEEVGVNLGKLGSGSVAVEKAEDSPFCLAVGFAHGSSYGNVILPVIAIVREKRVTVRKTEI